MRRCELTDEQWELIAGLFPSQRGRGRRFRDHRSMVNAMMRILNTGSPWRDLPERYGPWKTAYNRFNRWRREGLFDRVLERLQIRLDEEGQIDTTRAALEVDLCVVLPPNIPDMRRQHALTSTPMTHSAGIDPAVTDH